MLVETGSLTLSISFYLSYDFQSSAFTWSARDERPFMKPAKLSRDVVALCCLKKSLADVPFLQ
jgi:hypothetical protein